MALHKSLCIILAMIAVNLTTAQESSSSNNNSGPSNQPPTSDHNHPSFGFQLPSFSGFDFPSLLPFDFSSVREGRNVQENVRNENESGNLDRFRSIVRCNYTEQPGSSCVSCNQTLHCSRLNLGILGTCRRYRPYCNQGVCSRSPSDGCNATSST